MSYRLLPQPVPRVGDRAMCGVLADRPVNLVRTSAGKPLGVRPPRRAKRDGELSVHIRQVFEDYFGVYARRFTSFQTRRIVSAALPFASWGTSSCLPPRFAVIASCMPPLSPSAHYFSLRPRTSAPRAPPNTR